MKCQYIKEMISAYIDNELSSQEKKEFEEHIEECKECHEEYHSLQGVVNKINNIEHQPLPGNFKEELREKLEDTYMEEEKNKGKGIMKRFKKWQAIAGICVIGIFLIAIFPGANYLFNHNLSMGDVSGVREESFDGEMIMEQSVSVRPAEIVEQSMDLENNTENLLEGKEERGDNSVSRQEKIIYSGNLTLEVDELDKVNESIIEYTNNIGGFVEYSYAHNPRYNYTREDMQSRKEGYIKLRIPSEKFEETLEEVREMGSVTHHEIRGENITSQYRDIEMEVSNLELQEQRILEIMQQANKVEDILEVEKELNRIRTEINKRKTSLKNWDQQVEFSTIEISLREERFSNSNVETGAFENLGQKIKKGFVQSINLILEGAAKTIVLIAKAIPFIMILSILYFVYRRWFRDRLKKK